MEKKNPFLRKPVSPRIYKALAMSTAILGLGAAKEVAYRELTKAILPKEGISAAKVLKKKISERRGKTHDASKAKIKEPKIKEPKIKEPKIKKPKIKKPKIKKPKIVGQEPVDYKNKKPWGREFLFEVWDRRDAMRRNLVLTRCNTLDTQIKDIPPMLTKLKERELSTPVQIQDGTCPNTLVRYRTIVVNHKLIVLWGEKTELSQLFLDKNLTEVLDLFEYKRFSKRKNKKALEMLDSFIENLKLLERDIEKRIGALDDLAKSVKALQTFTQYNNIVVPTQEELTLVLKDIIGEEDMVLEQLAHHNHLMDYLVDTDLKLFQLYNSINVPTTVVDIAYLGKNNKQFYREAGTCGVTWGDTQAVELNKIDIQGFRLTNLLRKLDRGFVLTKNKRRCMDLFVKVKKLLVLRKTKLSLVFFKKKAMAASKALRVLTMKQFYLRKITPHINSNRVKKKLNKFSMDNSTNSRYRRKLEECALVLTKHYNIIKVIYTELLMDQTLWDPELLPKFDNGGDVTPETLTVVGENRTTLGSLKIENVRALDSITANELGIVAVKKQQIICDAEEAKRFGTMSRIKDPSTGYTVYTNANGTYLRKEKGSKIPTTVAAMDRIGYTGVLPSKIRAQPKRPVST